MSCSLEEHKRTAKAKLDEIFHETKTIKIEGSIVTITPSPTSDKIKTIQAASKTADSLIKQANDWGGSKYGKAFSDGWAIKSKADSDSNKIVIKLHFPPMLEYAINKKKESDDFKNKYRSLPNVIESHIKYDMFDGKTEVKSSDIIRNIGKSTHLLAPLANSLKRFALLNDVKVILEDKHHYNIKDGHVVKEETNEQGIGYYDEKTNTIYIAGKNEFKNTSIETILLHEIIHSIANYKLNDKNSEVAKDFNKLYEHAAKELDKSQFYGITNPKEFLVALFTDKKLINAVKEIKPSKDVKEYKNLLQEIGDWIMKILRIPKTGSLYEQAFSVATNIIDEQARTSEDELERIKYEASLGDEEGTSASKIEDENKKYSDYKVAGKMPFQDSTIEKLNSGKQKVTIRTANYPSGNYTIGNDTYNIINIGRKNIKDFENPNELRNSFKGDETLRQKHIQDFFTGKSNLFVYQITKIDESNKNNEPSEQSAIKIKNTEEAKRSKPQSGIEFERQYTLLKRKLNRLEKEVSLATPGTSEYDELKAEFNAQKVKLEEVVEKESKEGYVELGNEQLDWVENVIKTLPSQPTTKTIQSITDAFEIINAFPTSELSDLGGRAEKLREELFPYIIKHGLERINEFSKPGEVVTEDDINNDDKDIRWSSKAMGSLSDVNNHIGSTIGILIKNRQNAASSLNYKLEKTIQDRVDKLSSWAKANNMSLQGAYDLMIQENKTGTLILAQKYHSDGSENKNYEKIMNTPELKEFYDFYQKVIEASEANLPYKVGRGYILNKKKDEGLKGTIKNLITVKDMLFDSFVSNQQLIADSVPDMYRQAIPADQKSRDLGSGLLQFAAYANNHNELSKVLPEVRLLQEMLKYKRTNAGNIVSRTYKKSSNPKESVYAEDSNIFKMVDTVIDMQLKGKMKDNTATPINIKKIKDEQGNVIGYKQVHIEDIIDKGLRYNSLLRIGFSPITALSNVVFGDISNLIEGTGGRFFTNGELAKATKIFSTQTDYISNKKESNLYTWIHKLNPLQEFGDYDIGENLQAEPKKLTHEKALELMYSLQKKGEFYLQSRTMLAMLIHDGYMNADGTNTEKGDKMSESESVKFSDKVQRVNQMVHGRYSQREAATLQQQAWYRAAIQFRKWIPAYVESRFGDKKFDRRLMSDVEGRYRTFGNKVFKAESVSDAFSNLFLPLLNSKRALERGNMTDVEIYNMRKNLVEMIMLTACTLMIAGLKSGSDDDKKKKLKNPFIKSGLTMLNRASGDLAFFYNPQNATKMGKNAIPMMKLIDDVMTVGMTLPHALYLGDYEIKKGSLKGYNDFWAKNIEKIIPGLAPGGQIQRIANSTDILPELN